MKFGTVITIYSVGKAIYAVSEDYENGTVCDSEVYNLDGMTDREVEELINVGGVYTISDMPDIKSHQIKESGIEIASSVITDEGVELQSCSKKANKRVKTIFNSMMWE